MPVYDYACAECGQFTMLRPMSEYLKPQHCPLCQALAPRAMHTAPRLALMDGVRRNVARINERAAHEPRHENKHQHHAGCGCGGSQKSAAKSFPGSRPWMISH
jgi:putative FmdB family regulatory protein